MYGGSRHTCAHYWRGDGRCRWWGRQRRRCEGVTQTTEVMVALKCIRRCVGLSSIKTLLILLIFSLRVACQSELPRLHPRPPTTQPTKDTLDSPPLPDLLLTPTHSPTQAMRHFSGAAWRAHEARKPRHAHAAALTRKLNNSRAGRPPLGDGPWRTIRPSPHPPPPALPRPRPAKPPPPRYNTLKQPKRRYRRTGMPS